jgi:DNA-directed RNA polymerase specialized sigma24 family protein
VTRILSQIESGNPAAAEKLLPLVYHELRKLAAAKLLQEQPGQTLQATALVHEAYLRLVASPGDRDPGTGDREERSDVGGQRSRGDKSIPDPRDHRSAAVPATPAGWNSRGHFFAAAAEAMRRIMVESARRKQRLKHGGQQQRVDLDSACAVTDGPSLDLLALDEALTRLAADEPAKAELVKLRYFAGLTMPQAATALGISLATAERYWTFAKSWLYTELADRP